MGGVERWWEKMRIVVEGDGIVDLRGKGGDWDGIGLSEVELGIGTVP